MPEPFHPPLARIVFRPSVHHDLEHAVSGERITLCNLGAPPTGLQELAIAREVPAKKRTTCLACWGRIVELAILRSVRRLGGEASGEELLDDVPGAANPDDVMHAIHRLIGEHILEVDKVNDELMYQHAGVNTRRCKTCGMRQGLGSCTTCLIRSQRGVDQMDEWVMLVVDYLQAAANQQEEDRLARRELLLSWARGGTNDLAKIPHFGEA